MLTGVQYMNYRLFGRTGREVSEIGLGTWQLGTRWGDPFDHDEAIKILETAEVSGITVIDTADISAIIPENSMLRQKSADGQNLILRKCILRKQ